MNKITRYFRLLIKNKNWTILKNELTKVDPASIAELITGISSAKERIIIFRLLSREQAKLTFQRMTYDEQKGIIDSRICCGKTVVHGRTGHRSHS